MPVVQVNMIEGRTRAQKKRLIEEVTQAVHRALDAPLPSIRVVIHEVPAENWGIAGVPKSDT